jgi:hypothetical protein
MVRVRASLKRAPPYDDIVDQLSKHVNQWESMKIDLQVNKENDYRFHGKLWEQNQLARIQYEMEQIDSLRARLKEYEGNQRVRQSRVGIWDNRRDSFIHTTPKQTRRHRDPPAWHAIKAASCPL